MFAMVSGKSASTIRLMVGSFILDTTSFAKFTAEESLSIFSLVTAIPEFSSCFAKVESPIVE